MTLPTVGIGASAEGLEAVEVLVAHLPPDSGLAYVLVERHDPMHYTNFAEVLDRISSIPVRRATAGTEINRDHLYIIQPDDALEISGRVLKRVPRTPARWGPQTPINRFMRSLAQQCGSHAIGVILSGCGTDGAAGLEHVKAAGGVVFAQDPTTTRFGGMPQTAIDSGCVDLVLPLEEIAEELRVLGQHPYIAERGDTESVALKDEFGAILRILHDAIGADFDSYREKTVRQRIMRRLALRNINGLEEYRKRIENDAGEFRVLQQDLLVTLTRFFRDPAAFEALKTLVFPRLVEGRPGDAAIRVWVAGCATGEEAYSIAITLREYFDEIGKVYPVQIFASDISSAALETARGGKYGESIAREVSPERLSRCFRKIEGGYQIGKTLRDMCVFTRHDLIHDPPFSKLDLISCRNVLRFCGSTAKNIVGVFQYALKPGGILALASSETEASDSFSRLDSGHGIFVKKDTPGRRDPLYSRAADPYRRADAYKRIEEEGGRIAAADELSANEKLRTLNEELETAKEELESTNEELSTVNEELMANNVALTEAHDFAMLIIETVATPLLVLDNDFRITTANPSFYRLFRLSPGEVEGQFLDSISEGSWDIPRLRDILQRILPDHKSVHELEIEHDFPEIGRRILSLTARQLDGLEQILVAIDDVTERKQVVEATLHESEQRFQSMADTAPMMIWVAGRDEACTFFNKAWLAFTGRRMEEEVGNSWTQNVHPDDLERCLKTYSSAFRVRRCFQMEYRLRRADGEYRWLLDNGVPRFEPGGVFVGYIGSCVDVTDLKRAQEEQLTTQRLESVGTLAGGIAHDFNNLLGGILAHSELALAELEGGSTPEEELQRIRAAAIRGAEIVRQLMIYAGQENEVVEPIDLSEIVEDMLELLRVSVSKHAAIETDFGRDLPAVRVNRGQLQQIVMNLITNASEALGDRDGVVRVTTHRITIDRSSPAAATERLVPGEYVQLEVADTGHGMTPETQARVFDPFFTTKPAGHGLGLAVVQGIIRSVGGTILVTSAPGKGTTFQVLLPCTEPASDAAQSATLCSQDTELPSKEATILIAEDEESLRRAVSKTLRRAGLSVVEAGDGSAALNAIREQSEEINLLLLDITLPGASSRLVFEEAKRLRPGLRVIVTSAYSEEIAAKSLADHGDCFIRKPYRLEHLLNLIRETLCSMPA